MRLTGLLALLRAQPDYQALLAALSAAEPNPAGLALGLPRAARALVIAALAEDTRRPVLALTARADRAATLLDELGAWVERAPLLNFPEPNPLFYEFDAWNPLNIQGRLSVLRALRATLPVAPIIVTSARALMTRTIPQREFQAQSHTLRVGQHLRLEKEIETWVGMGYGAETIVTTPGQFSRRGGLIDLYPTGAPHPARIELFGDEIETIRAFDPATQRSGEAVAHLLITPAREALPRQRVRGPVLVDLPLETAESGLPTDVYHLPDTHLEFQLPLMFPPASLLEHLPPNALVLVDDWHEVSDAIQELEEQALELRREQIEAAIIPADFPAPYLSWGELHDEIATPIVLAPASDEAIPTMPLGVSFRPGPRFGGQLKPLMERLAELQAAGASAVLITRQAQRLAELWNAAHLPIKTAESLGDPPQAGQLYFLQGGLSEGWVLKADSTATPTLHLFTDSEIFGWSRAATRSPRRSPTHAIAPEALYADLAPGDYVVHVDFGVGRFRELARRAVDDLDREYLLIEYAENDELYVPIHQADRLARYIGVEDRPPKLARLGTTEWNVAKTKAQEATLEVARDLLDLYAKREAAPGHAFGPDTVWQHELEASFPYIETDDQLRAIQEVKADMERERPMDRLICGDVGYGKTEVALRAAFKAVMDGYQVAVLVPTTVLAQQHWHTFQTRLAPYPAQVEMLSRFRSHAEMRQIVSRVADGQVDILIGTHRLLQKDVVFKKLGLVIIDEEQRFGVTHKEFLKQLRTEVDVLTLTATPIPRTLYLSLTGVRDISTINTPPEERLPIITHSGPYHDKLARQAILRELDRGGQVFYVHNRVQSIGIIQRHLEELVPEARVGIGHGQMDEHELSRVMDQFTEGEIDVLLCTSIIESGLDIPNANTLIVERADTFGLAQLYQLRGRVGRSAARAYAYFFTDTRHRPTAEGRERLDTIAEQTDLGAGFSIAMRDLEMRGAGDILGARQHGQIAAVGFHLYTRLLAESVARIKGKGPRSAVQSPMPNVPGQGAETNDLEPPALDFGQSLTLDLITVDLPLSASLPADYVPNRALRLQLYRRLAALRDETEIERVAAELADRFGPRPRAVDDLLYQLRVKVRALEAGVSAIHSEGGQVVVTLPPSDEIASLTASLPPEVRVSKHRLWLPKAKDAAWRELLLNVLRGVKEGRG
jgi:transcription-repair coupling factor (superfamily II helicase)